jgi:hypothetical protein
MTGAPPLSSSISYREGAGVAGDAGVAGAPGRAVDEPIVVLGASAVRVQGAHIPITPIMARITIAPMNKRLLLFC